jgi:hypothetical protein
MGIIKRSRHIGFAVLRGTTLVCIVTRRRTGRSTRDITDHIARSCRDFAIDEVLAEQHDAAWNIGANRRMTTVSLTAVMTALLPTHPRPTPGALIDEVLRRYPALRRGDRLSRDRTVALYAVALALTQTTTIH